jgi:hypothetical protein
MKMVYLIFLERVELVVEVEVDHRVHLAQMVQ